MTEDLQNLEDRRDRLYQKLPSFGDFRLGIISETYTRCGKKNCACAHKDHPGHGLQHATDGGAYRLAGGAVSRRKGAVRHFERQARRAARAETPRSPAELGCGLLEIGEQVSARERPAAAGAVVT